MTSPSGRPRPTARATRTARSTSGRARDRRRAPRSRGRCRAVEPHHDTALALHVPRRSGCARAGATRAPGPDRRRAKRGSVRSAVRHRGSVPRSGRESGNRPPARRSSSSRSTRARFDDQRRDAGQPVLVVRRRQVVRRVHALDAVPERPARGRSPITSRSDPEHAALPLLVEHRLVGLDLDRAEPLEATEVVDAVHAENPTAIVLWRCELSEGAIRVKGATNRIGGDMRARIRSSVIAGTAMIGIGAVAIAPMTPPPEPHAPPTVSARCS